MSFFNSLNRYAAVSIGIFLFILPITHTVALRLICLFVALLIVIALWRRDPPPPVPLKWPLLFWAGACGLSLSWSIDFEYSLGEYRNEIGYSLATFFVFYYLTGDENSWRRWRNVILFIFVAISYYAIVNFIAQSSWPVGVRVGDRNAFSTYLVLVLPFLLLIAVQKLTSQRVRRVVGLSLLLIIVTGGMTMNRIMWPTIALVAIVFFILYFRKSKSGARQRFVMISSSLVLCAAVAVQFFVISNKKLGLTEYSMANVNKSFSDDPRARIWSYVKDRIAERPLTGYGYGRGILRADLREKLGGPLYWHAHNMLLNYTLGAGPLGAIALICLFLGLLRAFWILYRSPDRTTWELGVFGISLMVGVAAKTMTDDVLVRDNALLFWALVGMTLGLGQRALLREEHAQKGADPGQSLRSAS